MEKVIPYPEKIDCELNPYSNEKQMKENHNKSKWLGEIKSTQ